jgi:hypothetical protein
MSKNIKTVPTQDYEEVIATVAKYVEALTVIGPVSSFGGPLAAENAMYRAIQKEAAELGADAVIVEGPGIVRNEIYGLARRGKALQALAIRWGTEYQGRGPHALSATSTVSITPDSNQVIPADAPLYPQR